MTTLENESAEVQHQLQETLRELRNVMLDLESKTAQAEWAKKKPDPRGELASMALATDAEIAALKARNNLLTDETAKIRKRTDAVTAAMALYNTELAAFKAERALGTQKLDEERTTSFDKNQSGRKIMQALLMKEKQQELSLLREEDDLKIVQAERDMGMKRDLLKSLGQRLNVAQLTKLEQDMGQVVKHTPALAPKSEKPRGISKKVALASILGVLLGVLMAFGYEVYLKSLEPESESRGQ